MSVIEKLFAALISMFFLFACSPSKTNFTTKHDRLSHLPALTGDYYVIDSGEVERTYHIYVRLPEGYDPNDTETRYPVVYLTDGDSLFPMLSPQHLFLHYDDKIPEAIIVGIAYGSFDPSINKRDIDYANGEGAQAYQRFLTKELIPSIEEKFLVNPNRRILFGQSHGGSYVLYSAYTNPDLFWGRIGSNPSFRPDTDFFMRTPEKAIRDDLKLIITSGSADRINLREKALAWNTYMKNTNNLPWDLRFITIEGGTHAADAPQSYRLGMQVLFSK